MFISSSVSSYGGFSFVIVFLFVFVFNRPLLLCSWVLCVCLICSRWNQCSAGRIAKTGEGIPCSLAISSHFPGSLLCSLGFLRKLHKLRGRAFRLKARASQSGSTHDSLRSLWCLSSCVYFLRGKRKPILLSSCFQSDVNLQGFK